MPTSKEGDKLLKIAKNSLRKAFEDKGIDSLNPKSTKLDKKSGVFVTLYLNGELRGCIGFIESNLPLWRSVAEASRLSAFDDPRFPPLKKEELGKVKFEISILTTPVEIEGDFLNKIRVGRDGLIVEYEGHSGLLLPQVATEYGWKAGEFLEQTCIKAGLDPWAWKENGCRIYKFQAQIFSDR
jgi:uncharacterized protein